MGYKTRLSKFSGYLDLKLIELVNYYIFRMQGERVSNGCCATKMAKQTHYTCVGLKNFSEICKKILYIIRPVPALALE